ncbi:ABC-2 type transporter [Leptolyngbya boryana NIES-2135]|jgi:lipopolysaccharide transport system permease protein|uniref:Transport permease protein n=1 Tax=Leptolyngbya boryana NIES-2135 TaxID=1973484 RepID=A0A1Z4JBE6_LEPBY|nr:MULTISPECIES: ABC transporter permease [Leptolyngbya]BAY54105.1 ABC-2 type transporter [Leptolyngbya boryana NIES-2135]MBD2369761.1 ABC transporter permease [Leptolyngbya sp. FACHB-161]MBD2376038.1 ABC transporter permease [Leptolyngbya sp. FACHB-238]MBD2400314.1 ABC transporter permease [Leptolyngbya sp. FACHB-239]MBD2406855.1 ABC transporter permease [Leptolyngbya sp. FACHB-402]
MNSRSSAGRQRLTLEAGRTEKQYWKDLWRYRELFYFLAWRDILVRYKQTAIGMAWALIRPFMTMIVFSVVFGTIAKLPTQGNAPYPILVYSALLPWQFFSSALAQCSGSLLGNSNLLSKVYFPRLIAPASVIVVCFVDFLIAGMLLLGLMIWYNFVPSWRVVTLPFFIVIAAMSAFGAGLWLAALVVQFRDVAQIVPFIVQFGLYVSPVGYTSNIVPQQWQFLYWLNPMVGVIEGFRWAILGGDAPFHLMGFGLSLGIVSLLFVTSLWYFRRVEKTFADIF